MTVLKHERWTGGALGSDPEALADWAPQSGGAGTRTIVETPAFDGTERSYKHVSTTNFGGLQWTFAATQNKIYLSTYFRYSLDSGAGNLHVANLVGTTTAAQLRVTSATKFQIRNNATSVAISTMNANPNQWYRLEWLVDHTGTTQQLRIFTGGNLHGTTPDETLSGAYTQGALTRVVLGAPANNDALIQSTYWSYLTFDDAAFASPYSVGGGDTPLDTPTNFTVTATPNLRELVAACTAVPNAVNYEWEIDELSGGSTWTAITGSPFTTAVPTVTVTSANGLDWAGTYRCRVRAKAT